MEAHTRITTPGERLAAQQKIIARQQSMQWDGQATLLTHVAFQALVSHYGAAGARYEFWLGMSLADLNRQLDRPWEH